MKCSPLGFFPPFLMRVICLNKALFFGWILGCSNRFHCRKKPREWLWIILPRKPQPKRPYAPAALESAHESALFADSDTQNLCWLAKMRCLAMTSMASTSLSESVFTRFTRSGRLLRTQQHGRRRVHTWQLSPIYPSTEAIISQSVRAQRSEGTQHCCGSDLWCICMESPSETPTCL